MAPKTILFTIFFLLTAVSIFNKIPQILSPVHGMQLRVLLPLVTTWVQVFFESRGPTATIQNQTITAGRNSINLNFIFS